MPSPTVVHQSDVLQLATWSRLFINRWRTAAAPKLLDTVLREQLAFIDSFEDRRIAVLTTLEDTSGLMPTGEARKKAEQIAKTTRDFQILQAQVVLGDGFVAATFRALLTGITLAIRAPYPTKVFKSEAAALPWIAEQMRKAGFDTDTGELIEAVDGLQWG